ncbi:sulfatase family protein [Arthrobacter castelli]|uniref:sulfatase family protein n=1 Tax=Arthrobacter castelli TaxID=271431 RepID=UPI0003F59764|nr:sulfatase [Arthrobacter castelli]
MTDEPTTSLRPNIVLIFMDDMGYGDLGCTGNQLIKTPRMDQLAADGMMFDHMYSAAPTCTPSRAALMSGRYAQRVGLPRVIFPQEPQGLSSWEVTVADILSETGYACGIYGKWHLGAQEQHHPLRHGFKEFVGLPYSNDMDPLSLYVNDQPEDGPVDQTSLTRRYTDSAMDFIERHRDEPFFVYLPHTMPHIPLHVEEDFRGTSAAGTYGDVIECLDHHVGRLIDHLDQLGLAENTLVMVTSDNGPWYEGSTGGFRGRKIDTYEGGIRMPFIARWPQTIHPGSRSQEPACFIDMLPTLAGLTGAQVPQDRPIDGIDISGLFSGDAGLEREALYFYAGWHLNAIRQGRWKLHVDRFPNTDLSELPQLFDVVADPQESYNLADLHPGVLEQLNTLLTDFGDHIDSTRQQAEERAHS